MTNQLPDVVFALHLLRNWYPPTLQLQRLTVVNEYIFTTKIYLYKLEIITSHYVQIVSMFMLSALAQGAPELSFESTSPRATRLGQLGLATHSRAVCNGVKTL